MVPYEDWECGWWRVLHVLDVTVRTWSSCRGSVHINASIFYHRDHQCSRQELAWIGENLRKVRVHTCQCGSCLDKSSVMLRACELECCPIVMWTHRDFCSPGHCHTFCDSQQNVRHFFFSRNDSLSKSSFCFCPHFDLVLRIDYFSVLFFLLYFWT